MGRARHQDVRIRRASHIYDDHCLLAGALIDVWLFDAHPSFVIGAVIGGVIAGLLQMTVLADFLRRRSLRYYERRWDQS